MNRYVVGFAFTENRLNLALIQKVRVRPGFEWMQGKMNGLGGMILPGEFPWDAMSREFREESGVEIPTDRWHLCGSFFRSDDYEVLVFRAFDDAVHGVYTASPEEGTVHLVGVPNLGGYPTVQAISWLIPLLLYPGLGMFQVSEA